MELKPFKDMLALSKEKMDEAMAPIRAKQVKSKAELEMAKLEADILTKETKVQEMCLDKDINLPNLLDRLDEIALLERRRVQYEEVLEQLFPKNKRKKTS